MYLVPPAHLTLIVQYFTAAFLSALASAPTICTQKQTNLAYNFVSRLIIKYLIQAVNNCFA